MKKKSLFLGLAALLMAGMTSCSSDDVIVDEDRVLDHDQSFFVNIVISNTDAMTRAEESGAADGSSANDYVYDSSTDPKFDKGDDVENKIGSVYLVFYNKEGFRVATTQVRKDLDTSIQDGKEYGTGNYIYKGVVQVDVKHGSKIPAYVMCFINPITSSNFDINPNFETLTSLQQTTRPRIIDDNDYFAMSKSAYFGIDRTTDKGKEGPQYYKKIIATPLEEDVNLFKTELEAKTAVETNSKSIVDIYVERYAAKVDLEIKDAARNVKLDDTYTLVFTPEYWAVNAYEENTYICKSFFSTDDETELSYADLVKAFGGTGYEAPWHWNNANEHRCYWAQSPAYYAAEYPRVADDILDSYPEAYALRYYSYNQMKKNATRDLIAKARSLTPGQETYTAIYARENTVSGEALHKAYNDEAASPKAAVASAVIVGYYKLVKNGSTEINGDNFYIAGNKVNGYTVYENTDDMKEFFVQTTIPFYLNDNGETFFDYNTGHFKTESQYEAYKQLFKVMHPLKAAREGLVLDSRYVTIQLDTKKFNEKGSTPQLYVNLGNGYKLVTSENVNTINQQMLYAAGTVQSFNGGKAYYNIPIKHLGFYRRNNPNEGLSGREDTFKWTEVKSGDFGLVRNHSYRIVVDKIEGLGNGIPDPDDPIVPPTDPEEYYIGARIIVLNWAIVPEQHVTL